MNHAAHPLQDHDPDEIGGHRLLGRLGSGGQGTVFLGKDSAGAQVAVKTLNPEGMADPEVRRRFAREAEAARKVASFCTAAVLSSDFSSTPPYIVSEYVQGPTLHKMIMTQGPLVGGDLGRLAVDTTTALASIHEAGIVHRDLKPGNVLMAQGGARVIDFGVAQITEGAGTLTNSRVGTPSFMAPEQIIDGRVTSATDVFAWGAVMVFAATGRAPFDAATVAGVLHKVLNGEADLTALPPPLHALVGAALAKDPAQRPSSLDVLHTILGRTPGGAAPPPPTGQSPPKAPPGASTTGLRGPVAPEAGVPEPAPSLAPTGKTARLGSRTRRWLVFGAVVLALAVGGGFIGWSLVGELFPTPGHDKFDPAPSSMEFGSEVAGSWEGLFTDGSEITLELPEGERIGEFEIPDADDSCSGEFRILDYTEEGYEVHLNVGAAEVCLGGWGMGLLGSSELRPEGGLAHLDLYMKEDLEGEPEQTVTFHPVE